ncbi:tRNA 2-selenouridine(34) synthase MnmH [Rhodobacteraceae bacterium CCMM004]|nr:tRNA 2-selenouridine(34) synthase MnmH [Rhodobacteraceae bacterium CCMM004]
MAYEIASLSALADHGFDAVIDVRAPSEFAVDRLPGAVNLPVLSDAERARVGTVYTRQSAFLARKIGAALVARNAAAHIEGPLAHHDGGWRPLVYCWRGGQRSQSFAAILGQIGWRVEVVAGGYRSYRRAVSAALYDAALPHRLVLLDGLTGTAKTALLHGVAARGGQILDLEGLARHRGSVFGAVRGGQPDQKAFESALAMALVGLDPDRPVLVEAESSRIGVLTLPPALWKAMTAAPRLLVEAPLGARASYLLEAYADIVADPDRLDATLAALTRLQGHARVAAWREMARDGRLTALAEELMRDHYDPRYTRQQARNGQAPVARLGAARLDAAGRAELAQRLTETLAEM